MKTYKSMQLSVPLGQSAGVQGAKIRKTLERNGLLGKKVKLNGEIFVREPKNSSLCTVRTFVLTTPLSARSKN